MRFELFLLNTVFIDHNPCIPRKQSVGIHDIVNDRGFVIHYRVISIMAIWKFAGVRESIQQSKGMD